IVPHTRDAGREHAAELCALGIIGLGRVGRDILLQLDAAPRVAGSVGVGDVVADCRQRRGIGADTRLADAEQVTHDWPPELLPPAAPVARAAIGPICFTSISAMPSTPLSAIESAILASAMSRN